MIFVVLYVLASAAFFVWVLNGARFKRLHSKVISSHPEMQEVRRTDPLLVVRFDDPSGSPGNGESSDCGFARFIADRGPDSGDYDRQ